MLNTRECKIRIVTHYLTLFTHSHVYLCIYLYIVFEELNNFHAVIFHNYYYRCHYEMSYGECCMGKKITQECINNDKTYTSALLKTSIVDKSVSFVEE